MEKSWSSSSSKADEHRWSTFVVICETCGQVLLYDNLGDQYSEDELHLCELIFPVSGFLHKSVPKQISEAYAEAYRIKTIAPNAFAVQIRRSLEAICVDRGETKGSLAKRLEVLASKGEIPPLLAEASDILRLLGNIGAHGLTQSVHPLQAYALDGFFRVIVEYLYIAPSKIEDFKKSMSQFNKEPIEKDS